MKNERALRMKFMLNEEWKELEHNFNGDSSFQILEYYDDIHTFVTRLCLFEKLPQSCISTAMIFFHKIFLFKKYFEDDYEKYMTCTACIFLSLKVCNQLTPLEELVKFFIKQYNRQKNLPICLDDQTIYETTEKLCLIEFDILSSIGFDLNIDLPYKYIHQMKTYFLDYLKNPKLITITTNFINDSFKLPLCLYFDPLIIALASLYLTSVYFKVPLPETRERVKWYHLIDKNVQLKDVIAIGDKINKIYKFCNEAKTSKKIEFVENKPVIKFEPESLLKQENLKESILDVIENDLGNGEFQEPIQSLP